MSTSQDSFLRAFILDYCMKKGLDGTAAALRLDAQTKGEPSINLPPMFVNSPNSFLSEWFGMFWDVFQTRVKSSYPEDLGAPSLSGNRRASADRNNLMSLHRQQVAFGANGFSQSRPPHPPGPQGTSMAQSPAAMTGRSRAVAAASSRNSGPPTPYSSMPNSAVQSFALDGDPGSSVHPSGVMNVADAFGHIINPGTQRHNVSGIDLSRVDLQGSAGGTPIERHLRAGAQQHLATNFAAPNAPFMASLGEIKNRSVDKRVNIPDGFGSGTGRPSADNSTLMRLASSREEDTGSLRRTSSTMPNSKKRASVDSPLPQGSMPSSGALASGSYSKGGTGPKKRQRSSSFPSDLLPGGLGASTMQNQPKMQQQQHSQQQQQSQQIARGSSLHPQSAHLMQQRLQAGSGHAEGYGQQSQQERQRRQEALRHQQPTTIAMMQRQHAELQAQVAQHQTQQHKSLGRQDGGPAPSDLTNLQSQNTLMSSQRQMSKKQSQQHQMMGRNGQEVNQVNTGRGGAGNNSEANVIDTLDMLGTDPQTELQGNCTGAPAGQSSDAFPFMMPTMQNGNHNSTPARQSPANRQRTSYGRSKSGSGGSRHLSLNDARVNSGNVSGPLTASPNVAQDNRSAGLQAAAFSRPLDRNARDNSSQRSAATGINEAELMQNSGILPRSSRVGSGPRENGLKNSNSTMALYQQSAAARQAARKNAGGTSLGAMPSPAAGLDATDENISTKSDRQGSNGQGGGTSSQRSFASGASNERRTAKSAGSTRRPRSARGGGRRSRAADRNTTGTASPTAAARRASAGSSDQAGLASSGRNDGGPSTGTQVRGSPTTKISDGQRQSGPSATGSSSTGRNGTTSKKRAPSKATLARQQQELQKQQAQKQQPKHLPKQKQSQQSIQSPQVVAQAQKMQGSQNSFQGRKLAQHQAKQQPAQQKGQSRQELSRQNSQVGSSLTMHQTHAKPKRPQSKAAQKRAQAQLPQLEMEANGGESLGQPSLRVGNRQKLDGAQTGFAENYERAGEIDQNRGKEQNNFQEFPDLSNVDLELEKALQGPSLLMPETGGSGYSHNIEHLLPPEVEDMLEMNDMSSSLRLGEGNGFEDDGGILESADPNGVILR